MNLELSNAIKQKSKIRNKYNKWRSRENYLEWQNIKKKCKYLTKKAEKEYFDKILSKGIITNKDFWAKLKPALTESNPNHQNDIVLKENEILISDDNKISEIFNNHYINVVETSTGSAPANLGEFDITNKESIKDHIEK